MPALKPPVGPGDHIQGNKKAPVTLVEYGDYECPYCGQAYPVVKQIQKHFGNQLLFAFRNFPLTQVHPYAEMAAETAEFAADSDRFWEMHDLIYENQSSLSPEFLLELAQSLELSVKDLEVAIAKKKYAPKIEKDVMSGVRSGVNGTPTFFINGQRYNGPFDFEDLVAAIDAASSVKS